MELSLFPLKTVLYPHCQLSLKIFEPRYSDLVARCLRDDLPFGVVLIKQGEETDSSAEIYNLGTTARISDWQNRNDGLLGISVTGENRFQIESSQLQPNGQLMATVDLLEEEEPVQLPSQYYYMLELLNHLNQHKQNNQISTNFSLILYQLIHQLPFDHVLKQQLLEVPYCQDRAMVLHAELIRMGVIQYIKP